MDIPRTAVGEALKDTQGFKNFYHFLLEHLPKSTTVEEPKKRQREAESLDLVSHSEKTSECPKHETGSEKHRTHLSCHDRKSHCGCL